MTTEEAKRAAASLLEREYQSMAALFASLSEAQLERPVFTGEGVGWRIRDLIPHFAFWQTISARVAEEIAQGRVPTDERGTFAFLGIESTTDASNADSHREWRDRPAPEALRHLLACHVRLMEAVQALPAERIVKSEAPEDWYRYFWQPGVNHLRQHRLHIEAALKETATT